MYLPGFICVALVFGIGSCEPVTTQSVKESFTSTTVVPPAINTTSLISTSHQNDVSSTQASQSSTSSPSFMSTSAPSVFASEKDLLTTQTKPGEITVDVNLLSSTVATEHDVNLTTATPTDGASTVSSVSSESISSESTTAQPGISVGNTTTHYQIETVSPDNTSLEQRGSESEVTTTSPHTTEPNTVKSRSEGTTEPSTRSETSHIVTETKGTTVSDTTTKSETTEPGEAVEQGRKGDRSVVTSTLLSIFGVILGVAGALVILLIVSFIYRHVSRSGKRKMCLNKEAKRTDWLTLRRFTINDVRASLGGIPANRDIWLEMNKDSSVVV